MRIYLVVKEGHDLHMVVRALSSQEKADKYIENLHVDELADHWYKVEDICVDGSLHTLVVNVLLCSDDSAYDEVYTCTAINSTDAFWAILKQIADDYEGYDLDSVNFVSYKEEK